MATSTPSSLTRLRSRPNRGTYSTIALKEIFKASPVAHCAYLHPGNGMEGPDGEEKPRILNLPLLTVLRGYKPHGEQSDGDPEENELVVYLHTYYGSRLIQAIKAGLESITISTSKVDGLVLGPVPKGHSVNYRSATIYGHSPILLANTPDRVKEKIDALEAVIDDVTGYNRTKYIGRTDEEEAKRTAVVRIRIEDASCKQRTGGDGGDVPPVEEGDAGGKEFTGVVPCWVQFGAPRGIGGHKDEVKAAMEERSKKGEEYANEVALARTRIDGR